MEAIELWLTFIKNAGGENSIDELMNKLTERSEVLKMANEMLKEISADEELREEYYAREKARLDRESSLYYAKEQGIEQEKLQTVRNALSQGLDIELIAKITGLSKEEIEKIKRKG